MPSGGGQACDGMNRIIIRDIQLRLLDYMSSCKETIEISHPYFLLDPEPSAGASGQAGLNGLS